MLSNLGFSYAPHFENANGIRSISCVYGLISISAIVYSASNI